MEEARELDRLRLALAASGEAVFEWTAATGALAWTDAAGGALGFDPETVFPDAETLLSALDGDAAHRLRAALGGETGRLRPLEVEANIGAGRVWLELCAVRLDDGRGAAERLIGTLRRIDTRKASEAALIRIATRDELTGHLNRPRLRETLQSAIHRAEAQGAVCAYLVAAIDKLAVVNEAYGFAAADEVLVAAGRRLQRALRGEDAIGRIGGNKFGLVIGHCAEAELERIGERLREAVGGSPVETRAGAVSVTISLGGVLLPRAAATSQEAMLRAEEALERARDHGRNSWHAVTQSSEAAETGRRRTLAIANEVISALNEERFALAFQPMVESASGRPAHYECLLRLTRRDGGLMPAGEFVPVSEQLGLIRQLDRSVLERAVDVLHRHNRVSLAINVSGVTACDPAWLKQFLSFLEAHASVAPRLVVEITETAMIRDLDETARFAAKLREIGAQVAVDDFGAGYTSFRHLQALKPEFVKIDGSYIRDLADNEEHRMFVDTLVQLARALGARTVAEWVAREQDAAILREMGVDYLQGFLYGAPDLSPDWLDRA